MLLSIKLKIWKEKSHPSDIRITCCNNCGCIIKYPKLLELGLGITNKVLPKIYNIKGDGIFKNINDNIIIVCKDCNNLNLDINECPDFFMIPKEIL
jgi:hypothetical protein